MEGWREREGEGGRETERGGGGGEGGCDREKWR